MHSQKALKYIIDVFGIQNIALGSDYPFPLGDNSPGSLFESLNLSVKEVQGRINELC